MLNLRLRSSFEIHLHLFEALAIAIALATACSCGGASGTPTHPTGIAISPVSASLAVGATQQFNDTVAGGSNSAVIWSVNGVNGGNSTVGSISNSGLYTAPSTTSPGTVTVAVNVLGDRTINASASVTVRRQVLAVAASPAQGMTAEAALSMVRSAGARGQGVDLHWPALEPSPGVYDFTEANQIDAIKAQGPFLIHITLGVINTTVLQVPSDLASVQFDSPQFEIRFQNMLTTLLDHFGSKIDSIAIGNEVDVYLTANPTEWTNYANFYGAMAATVRTQYPWIRVGVTSTFGGATSTTTAPLIASLNSVSDLFMINYYPVNSNFTPRDPSVVAGDFTKILAASPNKPILLQEVGFPTSSTLGSSEWLQAQVVTNVFSAWMNAGDKIQYLNFFLLHDDTPANCQTIANQFGVSDPNFVLFFCSLGLRTSDGTDKQGWVTLKAQAIASGFAAQ